MFERCSDPTRHAIFYARALATLNGSLTIDSEHLLRGLIWPTDSRAQELFRLREIFPLYRGCPWKFPSLESAPQSNPQLTDDAKRILARTQWEADLARDYWIDTEHLLLLVTENKPTRPNYGPVSPWWGLQSPLERLWFKWQTRKYEL
jgi:ATP-dependent Clp protease ATP-binding subunit ClpA